MAYSRFSPSSLAGAGRRRILSVVRKGHVLTFSACSPVGEELTEELHVHHDCFVEPGGNAIYDATGNLIPESCLRRGALERPEYPHAPLRRISLPAAEQAPQLDTVVFVPYAGFNHFGHLLTEAAAWLGSLLDPSSDVHEQASSTAIILLGGRSVNDPADVRKLLDLPEGIVRSTRSLGGMTRCRRVLIPSPSMINRHGISRRHFAAVKRLVDRWFALSAEDVRDIETARLSAEHRGTKTYLSRSRLPMDFRRVQGEALLEQELASQGWKIIHPETLSIRDQLIELASSRCLAGSIGSALHLLMYFGEAAAGMKVIGLGMTDGTMPQTYRHQFHRQGIDFYHLCCIDFTRNGRKPHLGRYADDVKLAMPAREVARILDALAECSK